MISNSDFEKLWFLYKSEGEPNQISINEFCIKQGVEYTKFNAWYRRTRKQIVPVQIEGMPSPESEQQSSSEDTRRKHHLTPKGEIMVQIQTRSGLKIRQTNLDYQGLKQLVEKLEGLC
jgi:hypothetical protein